MVILHKSFPAPQKEPMSLTDLISIYPPMKATNFFGLQTFSPQPDPDIITSAPGYSVLTAKQRGIYLFYQKDPSVIHQIKFFYQNLL